MWEVQNYSSLPPDDLYENKIDLTAKKAPALTPAVVTQSSSEMSKIDTPIDTTPAVNQSEFLAKRLQMNPPNNGCSLTRNAQFKNLINQQRMMKLQQQKKLAQKLNINKSLLLQLSKRIQEYGHGQKAMHGTLDKSTAWLAP